MSCQFAGQRRKEKVLYYRLADNPSLCVEAPKMNYQKIYDQLIARAQVRQRPEIYCEEHHIIPECMGGSNESNNLVWLTAREHLLAHLILIKIYPNNRELAYAVFRMSNYHRYGTKEYAWVRELFSKSVSGKNNPMYGKGDRQKGALNHLYGKSLTPEHIEKIRINTSLALNRPEVKKKMSDYTRNNNPMNNPEIREKQLAAVRNENHRNKLKLCSSGENNPMFGKKGELAPGFGTKWINNGITSRRIPKDSDIPENWVEGKTDKRKKQNA